MKRYRGLLFVGKSGMLAALLLGSLGLGGCGLFGKSEDQPLEQVKTKEEPGKTPITVGELDQMAKNFSDRLVARVSTACDHLKKEASDEALRAKAHQLKLAIALAAYDIVTSSGGSPQVPGAAPHVLDLAVLAELQSLRWVEEGMARDDFGERGERLAEAFQKSREDIWEIAARVMKPEQIDRLKTLVAQWRAKNLKVEWLARVRFDIIAQGKEGAGILESLGAAFNPIHGVMKSVDDTRVMAQQALFYLKRAPLLIDWTTEATLTDALAIPKVSNLVRGVTETLGSVARLTAQLEHLVEPSSQEPAINSTIQEVQESLIQAKELVREVHHLEEAVRPFLEKSPKDSAPKKPTDYEAVASKVSDAAHSTTSLVRETRMLAESPSAVRNVDEMLARVSQDVARRGRDVVDHAAWRAVQLVLLIAVLIAGYKGVRYWWSRRKPALAS